ncbi:MAG TPA: tRNA glutamyl-Q(34) synthetase GluQRS [Myxococcales bacterium]|nr:tRNA glutamyl-Q(34) synthetase GluQRS [Myxococcales bacterium]
MTRGRFAPSPTGELHLGALRTALLAWLAARASGGTFVVRVEDLDRERVRPGLAERQLHELRALGIDWDEGPDVGGPFGPYVQSERGARYAEALRRLEARGLVYPCYCSRADVAASAPHGPEGPRYPGTCRELTAAERAERERAGRQPTLRFRTRAGTVAFEDEILGRVEQDVARDVGDFVVRRFDGTFAYQLAVVVDDVAMQMTDVVRGADLASSTPRQILLYEALGAPPPRFAHVPLILGPSGEKLSKRDGAVSLEALAREGVTAGEALGELARVSALDPGARTARDLLPGFELAKLPREPVRWSPAAFSARRGSRSSPR